MSNMQTQGSATNAGGSYFCNHREFAIGGHCKMILSNLKGPTSYETGGVKVDPQSIGAGSKGKIADVGARMSDSGTYAVRCKYVSLTEMRLIWTVYATAAEVANAVDLSAELLTGIPIIFIP